MFCYIFKFNYKGRFKNSIVDQTQARYSQDFIQGMGFEITLGDIYFHAEAVRFLDPNEGVDLFDLSSRYIALKRLIGNVQKIRERYFTENDSNTDARVACGEDALKKLEMILGPEKVGELEEGMRRMAKIC